jgi:hypothetical protein
VRVAGDWAGPTTTDSTVRISDGDIENWTRTLPTPSRESHRTMLRHAGGHAKSFGHSL